MTTFAHTGNRSTAETASVIFAALVVLRRLRRALKRRKARQRIGPLPDYLLADIGLTRRDVETATIWGRGRL